MSDIYELAADFRRALLRSDAATLRDLTAAYRVAFARIEARLERLLEKMEAARARGEKISAAWLFQEQRLATLLVEVQREINRFSQNATGQITQAQGRAVSAALDHAEKLVAASLAKKPKGGTVAPNFVRLPKSAVESLVGFLADGSPLQMLLNQLGPDAARGVQEALVAGVAAGSNPRRIASEVKVALGGNLTRALRISRTEVMRAHREATHRSFEANADLVEKWVWTASLSPRTCAVCWAMHGTEHPTTERMASHVNCRCTMVPLTKTWEELGFTGLQETRAEVEKGEDAFAKLTPAEQEQVLGPAKFAEYSAGRLKLADLVGYKDHPRWGRSVSERSLQDALAGPQPGAFPVPLKPPPPQPVPPSPAPPPGPSGRPTTRAELENSPQFKRWFGQSKVVDENGRPLIVYHGTPDDITAFDLSKAGRTDAGSFGKGFYFTGSAENAGTYSRMRDGSNVMPVYLSLQNPLVIDIDGDLGAKRDHFKRVAQSLGVKTKVDERFGILHQEADDVREGMLKAGYDGVLVYGKNREGERYLFEAIAYQPNQIKSATGNSGAFDPSSDDLTDAHARTAAAAKPVDGAASSAPGAGAPSRDALTAQHFNGRVTVAEDGEGARARFDQIVGRRLSDSEIGLLFGVPDGGQIRLSVGNAAYVTAEHPLFEQPLERIMARRDGKLTMTNENIKLRRDAPKGLGSRIFAHQVANARALKVREIRAHAAREADKNGYYTWPRLGYNASIPASLRRALPDGLKGAKTLHDLMRSPEGRAWWKENGDGVDVRFDLRDGSDSLKILSAYLKATGVKVNG
jgi:SPP1 gp7 family putative phage head morphogenesis protein